MSTAAKATAPEPLPSEAHPMTEADIGCAMRAAMAQRGQSSWLAGGRVIAAHVASQTAELRAILERTQADLSRMTDKANALVGARIAMERTQAELADARNDAAWQRARADRLACEAIYAAGLADKLDRKLRAARNNAAKRNKRKAAK